MRCARAGPMPGRVWSSASVAVVSRTHVPAGVPASEAAGGDSPTMPTRICSPSTRMRARLIDSRSASGVAPPAAVMASMTREEAGRVSTPGKRRHRRRRRRQHRCDRLRMRMRVRMGTGLSRLPRPRSLLARRRIGRGPGNARVPPRASTPPRPQSGRPRRSARPRSLLLVGGGRRSARRVRRPQ